MKEKQHCSHSFPPPFSCQFVTQGSLFLSGDDATRVIGTSKPFFELNISISILFFFMVIDTFIIIIIIRGKRSKRTTLQNRSVCQQVEFHADVIRDRFLYYYSRHYLLRGSERWSVRGLKCISLCLGCVFQCRCASWVHGCLKSFCHTLCNKQ